MRKPALLLLCLVFCNCNNKSRQASVSPRTDGKGADVVRGSGKILGNDNPPSLFPVRIGDKFGYIDKKGKLVLKAEFAGGQRFSQGLAAVQLRKADRVGFIPSGFSRLGMFTIVIISSEAMGSPLGSRAMPGLYFKS